MAIQNLGIPGTGGTASYKYSKEWHVDPVNGLDTNDGSYNQPFQSLTQAASSVGNTGEIIYLHAGTYTEDFILNALNVTVKGVGIGGVVNINGNVIIGAASSSIRLIGFRMTNLRHIGACGLYIDSCQVTTLIQKTSSGYFEINDTDAQLSSLTIAASASGQTLVINSKVGNTTAGAVNHALTFKDCGYVGRQTHTQGTLALLNTQVFSTAAGQDSLTSSGVLIARNTNFYTITGTTGTITSTGLHSFTDVIYNAEDSNVSNPNSGEVSIFDRINVINRVKAGAINIEYDSTQIYEANCIVEKDNTLWISNGLITFEGFVEGTTGATWRKVGAAIDPNVDLATEEFVALGPIIKHQAVRLQADGTVGGLVGPVTFNQVNAANPQTQDGISISFVGFQNVIGGAMSARIAYILESDLTNFYFIDSPNANSSDGTFSFGSANGLNIAGSTSSLRQYETRSSDVNGEKYLTFSWVPGTGVRLVSVNPFIFQLFSIPNNDLVRFKASTGLIGRRFTAFAFENAAGKIDFIPFEINDTNATITTSTTRTVAASAAKLLDFFTFGLNTNLSSNISYTAYNSGGKTFIKSMNLDTGVTYETIEIGSYDKVIFSTESNINDSAYAPSQVLLVLAYDGENLDYFVYKLSGTFLLVPYFNGNIATLSGIDFAYDVSSGNRKGLSFLINTGDKQVLYYSKFNYFDTNSWDNIETIGSVVAFNSTTTRPMGLWSFAEFSSKPAFYCVISDSEGIKVKSYLYQDGALISTGDYIGIAQEDAATGNKVKVAIESNISRDHTGLVIGQNYYAKDAELTLNPTDAVLIGKAISSTSLLVNFSSSSEGQQDNKPKINVVLDNTIVDPSTIAVSGVYLVPGSGVLTDFIGYENQLATYDSDTDVFTFSQADEGDTVFVSQGANKGEFFTFKAGSWVFADKLTGLPTYVWDITRSYKANDMVVFNNGLWQANAFVPANTPFVVGINGSTWKQISASAALAEYGEQLLQLTTTLALTATTYDIMNFTIPSAGTWEVKYTARVRAANNSNSVTFFVTDTNDIEVPSYSRALSGLIATVTGMVNLQDTVSTSFIIETNGPTIYKLRAINTGTNNEVVGANNISGATKVSWNKIAGFVPATGQISDYIMVRPPNAWRQNVSTGTTVTMPGVVAGTNGIAYSESSGIFTLKANVTYELTAVITIIGTVNGEIVYNWLRHDNGAQLTTASGVACTRVATYSGFNNESDAALLQTIFTPTVDTQVRLVVTASTVANTQIGTDYCRIIIKQIGTTSVSQFVGMLSNEYSSANAYPSGAIVVRNNILYQANAPIATGSTFVEGTTGATWRALYGRTDLLAETGQVIVPGNVSSIGTTAVDLISFTLPSAGTWEVTYICRASLNNNHAIVTITDNFNGLIPNSEIILGPLSTAGQLTSTGVIHITVTAPTIYKLRISASASTVGVLSDTNGRTSVKFKKISGFIASTGSIVEYGRYTYLENTVPGNFYALNLQEGNLPVSGLSWVTLKAGNTYELRAHLSIRSEYCEYRWTTEAGLFIGNFGWSGSTNSPDSGVSVPAYGTFTPSTDTRVGLRLETLFNYTLTNTAAGEVSIKQIGTTSVSQFLGVLSNDWNISNSYPNGAITVKDGTLWQANSNIAASTPFVEGTSGATWRPMYAKTDLLAEHVQATRADNFTVTATTFESANTVISITIPSAGSWELEYITSSTLSGPNIDDKVSYYLSDLAGNPVGFSISTTLITSNSNGEFMGNQKVTVTTTRPTTYNLRVFKELAGSVVTVIAGGSKLICRKINGYIPATGQSVDLVYVRRTSDQNPNVGSGIDLIFNQNPAISGNILYNTSTGVFTLKAGVTYEFTAELYFGSFTDTTNGNVIIDWVDATSNVALNGVSGSVFLPVNRNIASLSSKTVGGVYTPTADQNVKLRCTSSTGNATLQANSYATIKQLGTSAVSQYIGAMSNNYNQSNAYPGGTIVVKDNALYQANAAIAPNTVFTPGDTGPTFRKLTNSKLDITKVSGGFRVAFFLAAGRLFAFKANTATDLFLSALNGSESTASNAGIRNMYEIEFIDETPGTIKDIQVEVQDAWVLFQNGNLYYFGRNVTGQAGDGTVNAVRLPKLVQTNVVEFAALQKTPDNGSDGWWNNCFIKKTDGFIYATGNNDRGVLGLNNVTQLTNFTRLDWIGQNPLAIIKAGPRGGFMFVQKSDGTLWAVGDNTNGQLGDGSTTQRLTAVNVTNNWFGGDTSYRIEKAFLGISSQDGNGGGYVYNRSTAILAKNAAGFIFRSSGHNQYSQLGDGTTTQRNSPVAPVSPLTAAVINNYKAYERVGGSVATNYFLTQGGDLYTWGNNFTNQIGDGTSTDRSTPVLVQTGVVSIHNDINSGYNNYIAASVIIKKIDGYHYTVGANSYGTRGDGTNTSSATWTRVLLKKDVTIKHMGRVGTNSNWFTRFIVTTDNEIYIWGGNVAGMIDGVAADSQIAVPMRVDLPILSA